LLCLLIYLNYKFNLEIKIYEILVISLIIRLFFVFTTPSLSNDIYRYALDGINTISFFNPYRFSPVQQEIINPELSWLYKLIDHREFITIYPPAAQYIFALGALINKNIYGIKIIFLILDMLACFCLIKLLIFARIPIINSIIYCWHPLSALEISYSGHMDIISIAFLAFSLYLIVCENIHKTKNILVSGIFFSLSVLNKIFPVVFAPFLFFLIDNKYKKYFISSFAVFSLILIIPFCPDLLNILKTLDFYAKNWEFSNFLFKMSREFINSGIITRIILISLFLLFYVFLFIKFIKEKNIERKKHNVFTLLFYIGFIFFMFSPTQHPWYLLYMLYFLPFTLNIMGIILSYSVFLSYIVLYNYITERLWIENQLVITVTWFSPIISLVLLKIMQLFLTNKQKALNH